MNKSPLDKLLRKEMTRKEFLVFSGVVAAAAVGVIGVIRELLSQAATSTSSSEPEKGTLAGGAVVVADSSASGGEAVKFVEEATPSVPLPLLGVYNGGAISDDDGTKALFGRYPDIASSYYQYNQVGNIVNREKQRIDKGIRPLITYTTKGSPNYMEEIANGSGAGYNTLVSYVAALNTVAEYAHTKGLKVYAAFDHEPDVKITQGMIAANVTPEMYAKALSRFITLCRANAPKAISLFWYAGYQRAMIDTMGTNLTAQPDMITFDPYSGPHHSPSETFEQMFSDDITWLKARTWYKGQPIALTEFGANHSDAEMEQFYSDLRQHMKNKGVAFGVFFNRADRDVVPLDPVNYPLSTAAFSRSLAGA